MRAIQFYRDDMLPFLEIKLCNTTALSYKKHGHEEYSVGLVEAGTSRFWYEGRQEETFPNTMVFLPPEVIHSCNPQQTLWKYKMLFIDATWVEGLMRSCKSTVLKNPMVKDVSSKESFLRVRCLLDSLLGTATPLQKEANLLSVFTEALTGDMLQCPNTYKEKVKLERVREYLHSCFLEKVTLDQLAEISGLNKFNIAHLFKAAYNVPPHTYQTLLRVNHAKKELRACRPLAEVALEAGFYDQSHFSRVFKNYTGSTPERYQKCI